MASSEELKPIHSLVLDTGPLIKNDPPANTLRAKAEQLYTLPCIISEIKDAATRSRVETTLLPFVTLRSPKPESVKVIREFARKTGDLAVLSKPDIEVLALGYELEIERNGGDWRLRSEPGQKGMNGRPPNKAVEGDKEEAKEPEATLESEVEKLNLEQPTAEEKSEEKSETTPATEPEVEKQPEATDQPEVEKQESEKQPEPVEQQTEADKQEPVEQESEQQPAEDTQPSEDDSDASDDEGGWITPSNLKKKQAATSGSTPSAPVQKTLQAAVLTSDYAMQNVALRMGLNLVAPSLARITHLKNWVLRCHGCFKITKDMSRQFCPSCGQPTLMRASCSTDQFGNFTIHLKKNFQWNNRGNVYSVPKPVHGSANGRLPKNAGGKNNWGNSLILSEDQKEFTRASDDQRRQRKKDIMDQDYLPDLLSGHRSGGNGKIRVGAGRNVNSKRKH
ncbi:20S-pre-rRNA D-site endonuclease NOB1 [Fusarium keratoplasticum]|uniref:20S-pre-rRNA D-site endonuclease NOB1 n=1 Tax=Fusarium keratoplasticum TaxID=1328300 RepID=A0ACC0QM15_9HYPO|nr:20S-pre-rRNA D-site endonuclease NOB1 [Fusarium keratoplasticum]KAI8660142.1 20S-pre-rRNA D-site endonuclease NOB1 [Fusarium keratoplasticum]